MVIIQKILRITVTLTNVTVTPPALASWLALPVFVRDLAPALEDARHQHGGNSCVDWLFDTVDPEKNQRELAELPPPEPQQAFDAAATLLGRIQLLDHANEERNRRGAEVGALPGPSSDIPAVSLELVALASSSKELQDAGLDSVLVAAGLAMSVEHSVDPIAPDIRAKLRDAVDQMHDGAPRRWIGWAYGALARRATAAQRPDLWQEEVGYLMSLVTERGGYCAPDLALVLTAVGAGVVAQDSRWERSATGRRQLETLLDIAAADIGDDADRERLRLAVAYLQNYDLRTDEDAGDWCEVLDRVARDLIGRLGYDGVNSTLLELGNMLLSTSTPSERIAELLGSWGRAAQKRDMLDLDVAASIDEVIRRVTADMTANENGNGPAGKIRFADGSPHVDSIEDLGTQWGASQGYQNSAEQPPQATTDFPELHRLHGVPAGLYSEDFDVRCQALAGEFGGWAFSAVLSSDDGEFNAAVAACAEMYTRGIRDTAEVVQEESVAFSRRIIFGLSHRNRVDEARNWLRQVVSDTAGKTTPQCFRARVNALWDLSDLAEDEESAWAERELCALVENSYTDNSVCIQGRIAEVHASRLPSGQQRIELLERAMELFIQAVDLEEWENTHWPDLILKVATKLLDEHRLVGDAANMVATAGQYVEWIASPATAKDIHELSYNVLRQLAAIPDSVDTQILARRQSLYERSAKIRAGLADSVGAFADALDVLTGEIELWESNHSHPFERMNTAVGSGMQIIHQMGAAGGHSGDADSSAVLDRESIELLGKKGRQIVGITIMAEDGFSEVSAALLYLRHGLHSVDRSAARILHIMVMHAADPVGYHQCKDHDMVRELYARLEPLVDPQRDGVHVPGFRRLAKNAARRGRRSFRSK